VTKSVTEERMDTKARLGIHSIVSSVSFPNHNNNSPQNTEISTATHLSLTRNGSGLEDISLTPSSQIIIQNPQKIENIKNENTNNSGAKIPLLTSLKDDQACCLIL